MPFRPPGRPNNVLILCGLLMVLMVVAGFLIWKTRWIRESVELTARQAVLVHDAAYLRGRILRLDEVLTSSCMMAAHTGEPHWERRYLEHEPQLAADLERAKGIASQLLRGDATKKTDEANNALVALETEAFDLVRAGQVEEARSNLDSNAYQEHKQAYAEGMDEFTTGLQREVSTDLKDLATLSYQRLSWVCGLLLLAIPMWLGVIAATYRYQHRLGLKTAEMESFVKGLQGDVGTRTHELLVANESLQETTRRLANANQQIRGVLDTAADGFITFDARGFIQEFNAAAEQIFGYQRADVIDKKISLLLPDVYHDLQPGEQVRRLAVGESLLVGARRELEAVRQDGGRISVELAVSEAELDDSLVYTGIVRDITDRRRAEQELSAARDQAEAASLAKSQFLASMSHELRTPLNGVIGMATLLLNTDLDKQQQRYVEACHTGGKPLLTLINDILDFSKIEAGKMDLENEEFDLHGMVENTVDVMAFQGVEKGLNLFACVFSDVPRKVMGDCVRIRQVLVNLIGNAIKFSKDGEINVHVTTLGGDERERVRFEVSDTGVGIAPNVVARLFSPFTQADGSTSRKYGGTGLGLAICKRLVELMEGRIGVESEPEAGSTFWFEIPFQRAPEGPALDIPSSLHERKTVLVIAAPAVSRFLAATFADWRMIVDAASSADEVIHKLRAALDAGQPFDLVVAEDQALPGSNLSHLLHHMKTESEFLGTKLLLICGHADRARSEQLNVDGLLHPPLSKSELLDGVNACMFAGQGARASKPQDARAENLLPTPGLRVLLAEDNTTNQLFAREVMRQGGMHCDVVGNGVAALTAVTTEQYDLVLMDCQMPEMDGFEATRTIRRMESDGELPGHLPIIALTANAIKGDRERCLDAGMDDYVTKPFEPRSLLQSIAQLVGGEPAAEPAPARPAAETADTGDAIPLDHEALILRCMGNFEFAQELLADFEADLPRRIEEISRLIAGGDAAGMGEAAHSLKGSAGIVGAEPLRAAAAALEVLGKSGSLQEASTHWEQLNDAVLRFQEALPAVGRMLEFQATK